MYGLNPKDSPGQRAKFATRMLQCARAAVEKGSDPKPFMDNINAIYCGRGTSFYIDSHGHFCCNTIFARGNTIFNPASFKTDETKRAKFRLPQGVSFQLDKITVFYPDGRQEVCKDRTEMAP
jgi:hypothetical protein